MQRETGPKLLPAGLTLVVPAVGNRPRAQRQPVRLAGAVAGAMALHAVVLAAAVAVFDATAGGGGRDADVIEISIVPGEALEAERTGAAPIVSGGLNVGETPGLTTLPDAEAGAVAAPQGDRPAKLETVEVEPPAALQLPAALDGAVALPRRDAAEAPAEHAPSPAGDGAAARAGGAPVLASEPSREDVSAAIAASPGEIDAYNRSVAVTLARLKPKGVGETGTAKVVFRIGMAGTVDDVRIAASTGKSKLDRLATETVARARFDMPPTGMTSAQLTYAIAFRFR